MRAATPAARRAAAVGLLAALAGLLAGRPDVVAIGMPMLLGLAWASGRRTRPPRITLRLSATATREDQPVDAEVAVAAGDADLVVVEVAAGGIRISRDVAAFAPPSARALRLTAPRWGRHAVGPARARTVVGLGMAPGATAIAPATQLSVLPAAAAFSASERVPRARGAAGLHRSAARGSGVELAGVRPWVAGDRLRRVNWRATSRTGALHTNDAFTDRSTRVWVLLDSQYLAGRGGRRLLDRTVRAATGIAEHYLATGDLVGLAEYGGRNRVLAPAGGTRQLTLARQWLLDVGPVSAATPPAARHLAGLGTAGSLVAVLTPLLDEAAAARLVQLRMQGAAVVAVDTLTEDVLPRATDQVDELARRLWLIERRRLLRPLAGLGVPVAPWRGPGTLDLALELLARMDIAPGLAGR